MIVEQLDPIFCKTDQPELLKPLLKYKKEWWRKEGYKNVRQEYPAYLVSRDGLFLAGFVPRIEKELGIEINNKITYNLNLKPKLKWKDQSKFRKEQWEEQLKLIEPISKYGRGVIEGPTGIGKTIIASAIISCFPKSRVLFLCNTIDLITQTAEKFKEFDLGPISLVGDNSKDLSGRIVIATIQSFSKLDIEDYCDKFDIVIVDECHEGFNLEGTKNPKTKEVKPGQYYKVLTSLLAPIRLGFSGTPPKDGESKMVLEGLIGPIISKMTLKEAEEKNILAKVSLKLIPVPFNPEIREVRKFKDIYNLSISSYRTRNRLIINLAKELNDSGKSCLIYIDKLDHGERLLKLANLLGLETIFVQGETEGSERDKLKKNLQEKKIMTVIASTVWKKGIDIPSLNSIFLAGGGKSWKTIIQEIGRGRRKDTGKDEVIIYDFVDLGPYISQHFCERLGVYLEHGWI